MTKRGKKGKKPGEAGAKTRSKEAAERLPRYHDAARNPGGRELRVQVVKTPAIASAIDYMRKTEPLLIRSDSQAGEILIMKALGLELPRDLRILVDRAANPINRPTDAATAAAAG